LPRLRLDHGEKRQLLQVHELRQHQRVQLVPIRSGSRSNLESYTEVWL
jgi:hypothetical protein